KRELEDAVLALTVAGDFVGEPAPLVGYDLIHLATEVGDGLLDPLAHRAKTLFVDGGRAEIHELVRSHSVTILPFLGLAADLWPGAKRRRTQKARPYGIREVYGTEQQNASSQGDRQGLERPSSRRHPRMRTLRPTHDAGGGERGLGDSRMRQPAPPRRPV